MYIAVINYNMGNISSVENALKSQGAKVRVTSDAGVIRGAAGVVLPGVGAFSDAMANLGILGLEDTIRQATRNQPFLGICLGMQLLFDYSFEDGKTKGLGVFAGTVERIPAVVKVPHMGWNNINMVRPDPLLENLDLNQYFYFVHSYHVVPEDKSLIASTTGHGIEMVAGIYREKVHAFQFHPEKSSVCGLKVLKNFINLTRKDK